MSDSRTLRSHQTEDGSSSWTRQRDRERPTSKAGSSRIENAPSHTGCKAVYVDCQPTVTPSESPADKTEQVPNLTHTDQSRFSPKLLRDGPSHCCVTFLGGRGWNPQENFLVRPGIEAPLPET